MTQAEYRKIALGAIRSQARSQHIDPETMSAEDALAILDDLYRMTPNLVASLWYGQASDSQVKIFKREWDAWKKEMASL